MSRVEISGELPGQREQEVQRPCGCKLPGQQGGAAGGKETKCGVRGRFRGTTGRLGWGRGGSDLVPVGQELQEGWCNKGQSLGAHTRFLSTAAPLTRFWHLLPAMATRSSPSLY